MNFDAVKNAWKSRTVWVNGVILLAVAARFAAKHYGYDLDPAVVTGVASALGFDIPITDGMTDTAWIALGTTAAGNLWLRFKTTVPLAEK